MSRELESTRPSDGEGGVNFVHLSLLLKRHVSEQRRRMQALTLQRADADRFNAILRLVEGLTENLCNSSDAGGLVILLDADTSALVRRQTAGLDAQAEQFVKQCVLFAVRMGFTPGDLNFI